MEKEDNGSNSSISQISNIRCTNAALLLSSLKSQLHNQEKEIMKQTIDDLKMELLEKSFKMKKLKLCDLLEFMIQIILLFSIFTFFVLLAFKFC